MSTISQTGFDGVSAKRSFVFGRSAARHASRSVASTQVVCDPEAPEDLVEERHHGAEDAACGDHVVARREQAHRQWSPPPPCRWPSPRRPAAPSRAASRDWNIATVGLVKRE